MNLPQAKISANTEAFSNDYENVLPDHYRLVRMVGRGGMAEVFLAEDRRLERNVAIKFLNSEFRKDPERMRRFHQEARAASALAHPNILIIHDIGEHDGVQFIISEFVEGETITSRLARGNVTLLEAAEITIQVGSALAASHRAGIVHRDIKPDNVMIRKDGTVKVLDFGLAKETHRAVSDSFELDAKTLDRVSTSPGLIMGTPQYMSPEQARGTELDGRSDIFSLGIILFEMVTGRPPFAGGSTADTIAAILTKEPRRLEELMHDPPLTLIRIIEKALRKDRSERYGTMEHMLSDLNDLKREVMNASFGVGITGGTEARQTIHNTVGTRFTERLVRSSWVPAAAIGIALLITALWLYGSFERSVYLTSPALPTVAITNWSSGPRELLIAASFSRDAKMVAYGATTTGSTEIWVRPTSGGEPVQVTRNGQYNQYPVWSPNGQELAFVTDRPGSRGIWRAPFTGGPPTQVLADVKGNVRLMLWGRDNRIYYQEGSIVSSVDTNSGAPAKVVEFDPAGSRPQMVEISPDLSAIAYSILDGKVWKLRTRALSTGQETEIATAGKQVDFIAWSPDGKDIFFSKEVNSFYQIFTVPANGGREAVQLSNGDLDFFVQDVSADGSRILYGSFAETSDLWLAAGGTGDRVVANDEASEYWADISPDGRSMTYQQVKNPGRAHSGAVAVKPIAGGEAAAIVSSAGFIPTWSPDGQWIAYLRVVEDSAYELWRVRPTGVSAAKIAEGMIGTPGHTVTPYIRSGASPLSWSPDGSRIAFSFTAEGVSNIWAAAADGAGAGPLTQNTAPNEVFRDPYWSPDGRTIAFVSAPRGGPVGERRHRIRLLGADGGALRMVQESEGEFRLLGFGHAGSHLLFAKRADPAEGSAVAKAVDIYSIPILGGDAARIATLANTYFYNIHLSRDGRTIAYVSKEGDITSLWSIPANGGPPKKFVEENDPKIMFSSLALSNDGQSIVFGKQTRTNLLSMLVRSNPLDGGLK